MSTDLTTEEKIKEAAQRVFIAKGFSGCTSREIAKEAGINVALLNYYFKSKAELYNLVCATVLDSFLDSMFEVFTMDLPLEQQVRIFIEKEYDFILKNPEMCQFVFNDMGKAENAENIVCNANIHEKIERSGVFKIAEEAQRKGEMRKVDLMSLTLLILSNCHFPVLGRNLVTQVHQVSEEKYQQHLLIHKQYVIEMIIGYLFPTKNQ